MRNEKRKIKLIFFLIILAVAVVFCIVVPWFETARLKNKLKKYKVTEYSEIVLEPKVMSFLCSCGDRTNAEMVIRVPNDKASEIETGIFHEPGYSGEIEVDYFAEPDKESNVREHKCSYAYDEYLRLPEYQLIKDTDKYCYFHITWSRPYNGLRDFFIPKGL